MKRIPLLAGMEPRDATRAQDLRGQNVFIDKDEMTGQTFSAKRAGLTNAIANLSGQGPGQGVFGFVDQSGKPFIYSVVNDTLNGSSTSSFSPYWSQL